MAKLTKTQLSAITKKAKSIRKAGGIKSVNKVTVYKKKWTDCIKEASAKLGYTKKKNPKQLNLKF